MKVFIQNIDEITDSRELLESRPQPFITVFIYTLILIIITAFIWSFFGEIDENVKARGIVRPNQKISSVRNQVTGRVENTYLSEGKQVKKGDLLFTIEHSVLDIQRAALELEYDKSVAELENLEKLKSCILDDKNYFDDSIESERIYHRRFVKYQTDMAVHIKQVDINLDSLSKVNKALSDLYTLKDSVAQNKNLFESNDSLYYNQFMDYSLNIQSLNEVLKQKKEAYDASNDLLITGAISEKEFKEIKNQFESAQRNLEKYKNEFMLNINIKINDNMETLEKLKLNLKASGQNTTIATAADEISIQKYKMDTIVQIDSDIKILRANIEKLKNELETVNTNIDNCNITSPIDGYINISTEINTGDLLQSGTEVATIVPEDDTTYKVQIYVSNADIANIKEGQKIKYHFLALPYKEYGSLEGTITQISTDARVDQASGSSFYSVEASVENRPLYSYKGVKSDIKVGMECEAQIIVKTKKILYYLLEKISLRD